MRTRFILCTLLLSLVTGQMDAFAGANNAMQLPQSAINPDLKLDLSQFSSAPQLPEFNPMPEFSPVLELRDDFPSSISDLTVPKPSGVPINPTSPYLSSFRNSNLSTSHLATDSEDSHWFLGVCSLLMVVGFFWFIRHCINSYEEARTRDRQKQWEKHQAQMQQAQDRATAEWYKRKQESHRWYADADGNISSNINDL